jgi:hypothetical protein
MTALADKFRERCPGQLADELHEIVELLKCAAGRKLVGRDLAEARERTCIPFCLQSAALVTSEKSGYRMLISLLRHWPVSQRVNSFECWMTIRLPGMRPNSG